MIWSLEGQLYQRLDRSFDITFEPLYQRQLVGRINVCWILCQKSLKFGLGFFEHLAVGCLTLCQFVRGVYG